MSADLGNLVEFKGGKVGRNDPCPCGSGKKYKKCCIDKTPEFGSADPDLNELMALQDPALLDMRSAIVANPLLLEDHNTLAQIGQELGSLNYIELALRFTNRAIRKQPKNYKHILNSAVMSGQLGNYAKALEILDTVPEKTPRRNIILGNILNEMGNTKDAIPLFEKAISEEPDFWLPYQNLIKSLDENSEIRKHWIKKAYLNCPSDPIPTYFYAKQLFTEFNIEGLYSEIHLEEILDNSGDPSIIGQNENSRRTITTISLFHRIAGNILFPSEANAGEIIADVPSSNPEDQCLISKSLVEICVNRGYLKLLAAAHEHICDHCKMHMPPINHCFFYAYKNDENLDKSKELAQDLIENGYFDEVFIVDYMSLLDDIGQTKKAIQLGEEYTTKILNPIYQARYFWDMSYYTANAGQHGKSTKYLEKFDQIDAEILEGYIDNKSILKDGNPEGDGYFSSPLFYKTLNIIFSLLTMKRFDEAAIRIKRLENQLASGQRDADTGMALEANFSLVEKLYQWAVDNEGNHFYSNELIAQKNKIEFLKGWGAKPYATNEKLKLSRLMGRGHTDNVLHDVKLSEALYRAQLREEADYSDIFNNIEKDLPTVRLLPEVALNSIVEAETRRNDAERSYDEAANVFAYGKTLEITLRETVFGEFMRRTEELGSSSTLIDAARADKKFGQFSALVTYFEKGHLELGRISKLLSMLNGRTAKRVLLLSHLKDFLTIYFPAMLDENFHTSLDKITNDFRNDATHQSSFDENGREECRRLVFNLLGAILNPRSID